MKNHILLIIYSLMLIGLTSAHAKTPLNVTSPDQQLSFTLVNKSGQLYYQVMFNNTVFLEPSKLGLITSLGDFSTALKLQTSEVVQVIDSYQMRNAKKSHIRYIANRLTATFANANKDTLVLHVQVSDHNIAFRYGLTSAKNTTRVKVFEELTAFNLPSEATAFITPQALPETGWMQTKPSYEEPYHFNAPIQIPSSNGVGFTFPALFKHANKGWMLISETGVDSHYVGSRLTDANENGTYTVAFPQAGENNGVGSTYAAMALPAKTPWRTITIGRDLSPIVESTIMFDVVEPKYQPKYDYKMGRASWSWIVWQDPSVNFDDQKTFIDLAAALNFEYVLIDALWDVQIGRDRMPTLVNYAKAKGVDVLLWYNSNGWWNDAPQTPKHYMHNSSKRKQEMAWLQQIGVKGLKVDFFGGDKQPTLKLYEDILVDANEHDLIVNFHGSTLPRGWERMYPNFVTSEAVLASENLIFRQEAMDQHAINATILPFTRNVVGAMDFAPVFLNTRLSRDQQSGTIRTTTDTFELATSVLYQSPVQHFGLTPNNLAEQPDYVLDFLKHVPADWDDVRYISGEPGSHVVLARRNGQRWYVCAVNGKKSAQTLTVSLPMLANKKVHWLYDNNSGKTQSKHQTLNDAGDVKIHLNAEGGAVLFNTNFIN